MQSAPLLHNEPSRLAELRHYEILDTPPDEDFDNLAKLAAHVCGTPIALISFIDANRQWVKAKVGLEISEIPRHVAFCAHTILGSELFLVPNTARDKRFAKNPLVASGPKIRFYAGVPIITPNGHAVGTLAVLSPTPKRMTAKQLDALRLLGRQAIAQLELRRQRRQLEHSHQSNTDLLRAIERGLEGVAFLREDGCFTYLNHTHATIYGYQPEELLGRSWKTLYTPAVIAQIEQYYFPILLHVGHWTGEVQGLTKSGQPVFVELSLVLSENKEEPNRWLICTCRNVTERVAAHRRIETSKKNLAQAQALAHVGSWEWNIVTGTEVWSDEQFRIFGIAPQAIIPTIETFREAIHPDDRVRVFQAVEATLHRDIPYEVTCRITRPSGVMRTIHCLGTVTRDSEGHPISMTGTVQDITEQKAGEQLVNDSLHRLDLATRSSGIGVWDYYIPENKLVWDRQMYEIYRYTVEDFPGAYEAWTSRLHPEDRADADAALKTAIEGGTQFDTEFRLLLPDQSIRFIKATASVLKNEYGRAVRMIGVNYDITKRKRSEEALRQLSSFQETILSHAPHAVIAATTKGIITHFNPAAERLLGYCADEMIGKLTPAVFHDPDEVAARAKEFGAELGITLEPGFEVFVAKTRLNRPNQHEWTYIRKDGTRVPVLLSVTAIRDHAGTITGFLGMAIDVTLQKEAEQARLAAESALREREELHRVMIENVFDYSIILLDPEGHVASWNKGAQRMKGYKAQEIVGRHFSCFYTQEGQDEGTPTKLLREATAHHRAEDEGWRVRKDGSRFWANAVATALFDDNGRLKGFTKVVRDMTERKQAEAALTKFKSTLDQTLDAVFMFDPTTLRFTYCNRGACEHVGYSQAELLTMTPLDLKPEFTEADYRALLKPLLDGQQTVQIFQTVHRNRQGHDVPVEVLLQFVQQSGETPHFVNIVRDITTRKQAEEQFRLVVESAPNGMLLANEQGVITLVNTQIERWFGYDRQELIGQPIEILVPDRFRSQHPAHRSAFFHNPHARAMGVGRDLFGRRKNGSEFPLEIGLSPIATSQGRQVLAAIVDISARKQAEEKLNEAAQELAWKNNMLLEANESALSATRAKSEFLATMSHEIRTPMNAIIGMAELLQETPLTPDQANYVGRFSRAAGSLMDLINAILDLSKIEAGYMTLESVPFDLHDLAETVADLTAGKALAKQLELLILVHPDVPQGVVGDPTRLNQVLVNLVGNAIKFTESGHVMIKIEPVAEQEACSALRFSVSDTGIGIPQDKLQTIFDPFIQADSTTTRKYGGTGLGLNISRRLVELMGGRLEVESTPDSGSTFSFVVQLPKASFLKMKHPSQTLNVHGRRLLVVDDNDTNVMIIREHLTRAGVQLLEAASGAAALTLLDDAHLRNESIDLAILDYHMPHMDGLELAEAIRSRPECATLPLIMHVSDLQLNAAQRAKALGIKSYLYKPLSQRRLMEALAIALGQSLPEPARQAPGAMPEPAMLPSCRILLVEDLEDNRDVITLFLKDTAYQVDMAENGAVGLQKFQTGTYDLVLMDMQMPVMDGLQATVAIRQWEGEQQRRPTPIVALTANAYKEEAEKCLDAGCTTHMTKPIKKKTLLATIVKYGSASMDQAA